VDRNVMCGPQTPAMAVAEYQIEPNPPADRASTMSGIVPLVPIVGAPRPVPRATKYFGSAGNGLATGQVLLINPAFRSPPPATTDFGGGSLWPIHVRPIKR